MRLPRMVGLWLRLPLALPMYRGKGGRVELSLWRSGRGCLPRPRSMSTSTTSIFHAEYDPYGGVIVKDPTAGLDLNEYGADGTSGFEEKLTRSLRIWREKHKCGIWLRLPIEAAALVPVAVRNGFWYHHCREDYLLLCTWLEDSPSRIPRGPSHYVGVAGFVVNSKDELLMIKEKDGPTKAKGLWKLPGGLVDRAENVEIAAIREVREETGLDCEFVRLAAIVESHNGVGPMRESTSDFYFVSVLKVKEETQTIVPQAQEIESCEWIPISEALQFPLYAPNTAFGECFRTALSVRNEHKGSPLGLSSQKFPVGFGNRMANLLMSRSTSDKTKLK